MDYPFVKQSSESYSDHVASLTRQRESRKQITANTIRILLLEEQNNELRHTAVTEAKELKECLELESPQVYSGTSLIRNNRDWRDWRSNNTQHYQN